MSILYKVVRNARLVFFLQKTSIVVQCCVYEPCAFSTFNSKIYVLLTNLIFICGQTVVMQRHQGRLSASAVCDVTVKLTQRTIWRWSTLCIKRNAVFHRSSNVKMSKLLCTQKKKKEKKNLTERSKWKLFFYICEVNVPRFSKEKQWKIYFVETKKNTHFISVISVNFQQMNNMNLPLEGILISVE